MILIIENSAPHGAPSGAGTYESPYIIEDYIINSSLAYGIRIQNINKYLIIQNCFISGEGSANSYGFDLYNATNLLIVNNTIQNFDYGIYMRYSNGNLIFFNVINLNAKISKTIATENIVI